MGRMNKRGTLVALLALGVGLLGRSPLLRAQEPSKSVRVGFLRQADLDSSRLYLEAFKKGLRDLGYVEARNLALELRFAGGRAERLPVLAAELVARKVDVIVASDTPSTRAARQATSTIPIVMANIIDPIGSGFVTSLARPGGNTTGLSSMVSDLSGKHLELLAAMVPKLTRVAVLLNPANSGHRRILKNIQVAAEKTGVRVVALEAETSQQIEGAFTAMTRDRMGAVIVANDSFFSQQIRRIAELAIRHRIPSITANRVSVETGLLASYGNDGADNYRHAAIYVDKILKGARPAELPVEQPVNLELIINLKTAQALRLTIPQSLLQRADRVID